MVGRLKKVAKSAKGIPDRAKYIDPPKIDDAKTWKFTLHKHVAERAGQHFDLRLGDPATGVTYNWAGKKMPEPGEATYMIAQPVHSMDYMDFSGTITGGYGSGKVYIDRKEPVEIISSSPGEVRFNAYKGRVPEQFVLKRLGEKKWVIHNATPSRKTKKWQKLAPPGRGKYKEKPVGAINYADKDEIMQAKIDGAHVQMVYEEGKPIRIFSHIKAKSTPTGYMEHTYKPLTLQGYKVPRDLHGTVARGEIYAVDKKGKALPVSAIGGLLNSSTWKSREKQKQQDVRIRLAPFDVDRYKGRSVKGKAYKERYELLKQLVKKSPDDVELPDTAFDHPDKIRLIREILARRHPETKEGVVLWSKDKPIVTRIKRHSDHDVWVRNVYPSKREGWAAGFEYSMTPRGKVVGKVGTGFTHKQREDMINNPDKYVGRVAEVKSQEILPSGALRGPRFRNWHIEKGR